jgi:Cu+-exporting ATPase
VLVVACPCALILATPSAFVAALSWLARKGVVVKGSAALERLASIDTIAFDKTGTLTTGDLALTPPHCPQLTSDELLQLTALATRGSNHPVSRVVTSAADRRGFVLPQLPGLVEFPGLGLQLPLPADRWPATLSPPPPEGARLAVGNLRWLASLGVPVSETWEAPRQSLEQRGESPLGVAWIAPTGAAENASPGELVGLWGLADTPRTDAQSVIRELRGQGNLRLTLLTGDRAEAARGLLTHLGPLDDCQAELLPQQKLDWVVAQQQAGHRVAMIGDGINDALALDKAEVGIAIARAGNDVAAAAGDIVLLGDPLSTLPGLLRLSRALVQTIRRSILVFAFGVNTLGVLLSAWGWFSPVVSALFHEAGSLAVMLYALRLLWFEPASTPRLAAWRERLEETAAGVSRWVSPSEWIFRLLRHRRKILPLAACLAGAVWMLSNLVMIGPTERALVLRFGRFHEELGPGIAWRWPAPLETVRREQVDQLRPVQLGFRSAGPVIRSEPGSYRAPVEWQTTHEDMGYLTLTDESLLLTGDELLLELTAEGQYQISDLREYQGGSASPEATLRAVLESAIREIVASRPLETLLGESRTAVEQACLQLARGQLAKHRLGLSLQSLHLLDVHPPGGVVPAYRDVANALEEREQLRNLAQTNAARTLLSVVGEEAADALQLVVRPTNDMQRTEVGQPATGQPIEDDATPFDWKLDEDRWRVLSADAPTEGPLSGQVSARLHAARAQSRQTTDRARGQRDRFVPLVGPHQAAPQLSQTHLYWQALESALANRPLVVLDPAARGRRQFWFPAEGAPPAPPSPPAMAPSSRPVPEPFDDEQ